LPFEVKVNFAPESNYEEIEGLTKIDAFPSTFGKQEERRVIKVADVALDAQTAKEMEFLKGEGTLFRSTGG